MAENDRPLPSPPRTRFGRQIRGEEEGAGPLTADRLTQAAAEGRLEEVLQHEIPEGEHARSLAMMMLGMSGMLPPGMPGVPGMPEPSPPGASPGTSAGLPAPATGIAAAVPAASGAPAGTGVAVPPEVVAAMMQGDVAALAALLRAEHARRRGERPQEAEAQGVAPSTNVGAVAAQAGSASAGDGAPQSAVGATGGPQAGIDKALIDELIRVAAENQVTVDWLMLRAVKLYLEEHRRTGRL